VSRERRDRWRTFALLSPGSLAQGPVGENSLTFLLRLPVVVHAGRADELPAVRVSGEL